MRTYRIFPKDSAVTIAQRLSGAEWSQGKARTKAETGTIKQNEEILDSKLLRAIGSRIVNHPDIAIDAIPMKCHTPKFSRYTEGARYHAHTDAPWMGSTRTDLACTLWLSDPDSYEGGELVIGGQSFKCDAGMALIYECGTTHEVLPVSQGQRICVITWIQSRIRDPHRRKLVSDYRRFVEKVKDHPELYLEAGRFNSALLRMWSES